jgi:hypothetical protein
LSTTILRSDEATGEILWLIKGDQFELLAGLMINSHILLELSTPRYMADRQWLGKRGVMSDPILSEIQPIGPKAKQIFPTSRILG